MGLLGRKKDNAGPTPELTPRVFEPQPLEDWDAGDSAGVDSPAFGSPDFYFAPQRSSAAKKPASGKASAKKSGAKKRSSRKPAYEVKPPEPGLSEAERRAALRAQMADLASAYKDAPLEQMEDMIKQTLAAHGQDVPDDWVTTIAEGLRRNGPTQLNYGGSGPAAP